MQELDRNTSYVSIELSNAWDMFMRSYFLSCALGSRTASGTRVRLLNHAGFQSTEDAIKYSVVQLNRRHRGGPIGRRDEPEWSKSNLLTLSAGLGFTILAQISTAFSTPTATFEQLRWARNFYAHRNDDTVTRMKLLARGLKRPHPRSRQATTLLNAPPVRLRTLQSGSIKRGSLVLSDWIAELSNLASDLSL